MKLLNKAQEEQLMEIVAHLRQVREEKSVRLEEIAAYTRIRLAFLHALEEGRFEELPEPVYVQGFIRHYGDAIGLDGTALAQTVANICSTHQESALDKDKQDLDKKPTIHVPLVVPYLVLLAGASLGLFYLLNPQRSVESSDQKKSSPLALEQQTAPAPKVSSSVASPTPTTSPSVESTSLPATVPTPEVTPAATSPTPTASPTTETVPFELTLELQDQSWLRVKVDGKTEFEGILNKGEKKSWTAQKELTIRSGNAGAVLVSTNNKEPTPLGDLGRVKEVTFTPETLNSQ
ncbi:RodZ domain-containing protein [Mastigocladopsis repens]|uniref:RodZ domain-containing protein n=1 Tax=Mastigocladopsis repens TaxID=221287 RepID=UPI00031F08EA|nr:RodZ domain-containing protein [Mastigocladopsis repens]